MEPLGRKDAFKKRVLEWAGKLGVKVGSLTVRPMRNKWASCSTAGSLSFNDELLAADPEVAEYVIVHELLHFRVPNHGRLWKSLMHAYLGDYERLDEKLRRRQDKEALKPGAGTDKAEGGEERRGCS